MSIYLNLFEKEEDVLMAYCPPEGATDGVTIHLAWYKDEDYQGDSIVIFEKDGQLFEVVGSHCSCYGLEGQWEPHEISWNDLSKDAWYGDPELKAAGEKLVAEHLSVGPK
jgi:hypothetical protein